MTKSQFGRSGISIGVFLGALGIILGACSKVEESGDDGGSSSKGGTSAGSANNGMGSKPTASTTKPTSTTADGGDTGTSTSSSTTSTGTVAACEGIVTTKEAIGNQTAGACSGASVESEALPTDMIILMDKSISNSYAIGTENASAAGEGVLSRWEVLTAGMEALATSPDAKEIGASITFFSVDGTEAENCNPKSYETPVVPFGPLSVTGPQIVEKMRALTPGGLTPTVPALQGAIAYAMQQKASDPAREKVVVLMSDGYPTICNERSPSAVKAVIAEGATAEDYPVRTFVVGIGDPDTISGARMNLNNYASAGKTGTPILIDETKDSDGVQKQIVDALLNISNRPLACEYELDPPDGNDVNPEKVTVTFEPAKGNFQELPRVDGPSRCSTSTNGGFYFDNPTKPTKVTVCPCNCAAFGAGTVNLVYGCEPQLVLL